MSQSKKNYLTLFVVLLGVFAVACICYFVFTDTGSNSATARTYNQQDLYAATQNQSSRPQYLYCYRFGTFEIPHPRNVCLDRYVTAESLERKINHRSSVKDWVFVSYMGCVSMGSANEIQCNRHREEN